MPDRRPSTTSTAPVETIPTLVASEAGAAMLGAPPPSGAPVGTGWRSPLVLLMIMAAAMQLSFAAWWNLMNNFAVHELAFTGREIGIQQSIREIPGFLAFTAIYLLLVLREQTLAYLSLALLGVGVAATGYFPSTWGFYMTTFVMSVGFHYYETMNQSLSLQWLPKEKAAAGMGKILSVGAFAQLSPTA